jgi:hypothetical protein
MGNQRELGARAMRRQVYHLMTEEEWRAFRVKAIKEGRTVQQVVTELMILWSKAKEKGGG